MKLQPMNQDQPRDLYHIAHEIRLDWETPNYAAVPYLQALYALEDLDDMYGFEHADMIVARFLNNATTWRGETARAIKKELKAMLKAYNERPNR